MQQQYEIQPWYTNTKTKTGLPYYGVLTIMDRARNETRNALGQKDFEPKDDKFSSNPELKFAQAIWSISTLLENGAHSYFGPVSLINSISRFKACLLAINEQPELNATPPIPQQIRNDLTFKLSVVYINMLSALDTTTCPDGQGFIDVLNRAPGWVEFLTKSPNILTAMLADYLVKQDSEKRQELLAFIPNHAQNLKNKLEQAIKESEQVSELNQTAERVEKEFKETRKITKIHSIPLLQLTRLIRFANKIRLRVNGLNLLVLDSEVSIDTRNATRIAEEIRRDKPTLVRVGNEQNRKYYICEHIEIHDQKKLRFTELDRSIVENAQINFNNNTIPPVTREKDSNNANFQVQIELYNHISQKRRPPIPNNGLFTTSLQELSSTTATITRDIEAAYTQESFADENGYTWDEISKIAQELQQLEKQKKAADAIKDDLIQTDSLISESTSGCTLEADRYASLLQQRLQIAKQAFAIFADKQLSSKEKLRKNNEATQSLADLQTRSAASKGKLDNGKQLLEQLATNIEFNSLQNVNELPAQTKRILQADIEAAKSLISTKASELDSVLLQVSAELSKIEELEAKLEIHRTACEKQMNKLTVLFSVPDLSAFFSNNENQTGNELSSSWYLAILSYSPYIGLIIGITAATIALGVIFGNPAFALFAISALASVATPLTITGAATGLTIAAVGAGVLVHRFFASSKDTSIEQHQEASVAMHAAVTTV